MKKYYFILLITSLILSSCSIFQERNLVELSSDSFQIAINEEGFLVHLLDIKTGQDYLSKDSLAPLMSIRVDNEILYPKEARLTNGQIVLVYNGGIEASIIMVQKASHLTFELISINHPENVDLMIWGPYPLTINQVIGETVGVVQGADYAIGIQALNPKTLGGYPWNENDCMPQIDIFENGDFSDMSEEGKSYVLYRVEAAKPTNFGSSLQAYCRDRSADRIIENWGHQQYLAPAYDDGGYIGSKIALFGAPLNSMMEYLESIEIAENLPHATINGKWAKTDPEASSAYLIMGFGEEDILKAIELTKKAGLKYLYHDGPFENWGHFDLKKTQFPNGVESMKNCVDLAKEHGIRLGLHTLSNFVSTNDPYVTPIPDQRLAKVGSSHVTEEINAQQTEIAIVAPDFFNQYKNNHLKTVMLGEELIRYGFVSEQAPWKLLDCERGAFNTIASSHPSGSNISKLADHGYKVFLTDNELSKEMSENIAELYNQTGLCQISFDGLEGNRSTGMGNYGEILFTKAWYDALDEDIKANYIADASRTTHYFWHIYTRMNWGEPWYAGFRESQTEYRLKNQKYFKRNLMPGMLGWFSMKPETSVEDIEWLLARSAAFDAGYAFVTNYDAIEKNGNSDLILELIGQWEHIRMAGLFSEEQKKRMEDISNEFTIEKEAEKSWNLYQVYSHKFKHKKKIRQPGEPLFSTFNFENQGEEQNLNFILTAVNADISEITLEKDHHKLIQLPILLKKGQHIKYMGSDKAFVYDQNWQLLKEFVVNPTDFNISNGEHTMTINCQFSNAIDDVMLKVELRMMGEAEPLALE